MSDVLINRVMRQIELGDGGELLASKGKRPPMHSAYSSAALAVNSFAPWLDRAEELRLVGRSGFFSVRFERKCPILGVRGKPPNLDVWMEDIPRHLVAIESKCTEYLARHKADFSAQYDDRVKELATPGWKKLYKALHSDNPGYTYLDVAQLVKHYLGLKSAFNKMPVTLVYAYWEPTNWTDHDLFGRHRKEVDNFEDAVDDRDVRFVSIRYRDLWDEWEKLDVPWVRRHVKALRRRYQVSI